MTSHANQELKYLTNLHTYELVNIHRKWIFWLFLKPRFNIFRPSIFQAVFTVTTEILADTKPTASDLFAITPSVPLIV